MDRKKLLTKLACLVGYLLFAVFSAYFTASSLSLNLLNGNNLWLVLVLVLVVAILASWCLTEAISEAKSMRPSRFKFSLYLIGFIIFWAFSFTTNVHYFFVEKHGFSILSKELIGAKYYIVDNTTKSDREIDDKCQRAQSEVEDRIRTQEGLFDAEIRNTMDKHYGFGEKCITILNSAETILRSDNKIYDDHNTYEIYYEKEDVGDYGVTDRKRIPGLKDKYTNRMLTQKNIKLDVIKKYYDRKKEHNTDLTNLLDSIDSLEKYHLPLVEKDGSVNSFYKYNSIQSARVISKMPLDFEKKNVVKTGDNVKAYNIYPSNRMFDTMSVWGDIISGRLADMSMIQWIIIALIFDIVSFILFTLFRKL